MSSNLDETSPNLHLLLVQIQHTKIVEEYQRESEIEEKVFY
jgi:hypothetical protein